MRDIPTSIFKLACGGLFVALLGVAATPAAAVPCTAGEFLGSTTYVTRTYTPTAGGLWQSGSVTWWRNVTYSCTQTTKLVEACYKSRWDRFWAWGGTMKRVTVTVTPLANFQRHETRYFCGSTPPSDALPASEEELELAELTQEDVPGSTAGVFATVARVIGPPGTGLVDPLTANFNDILMQIGNNTLVAVSPLNDLAAVGVSVQDATEPPVEALAADVAAAMAAVAASLVTGAPVDPAPYSDLAAALSAFAGVPEMVSDPIWGPALAHLGDAAGEMQAMAALVASGLVDDSARLAFLDAFEAFRRGLLDFALAFADGDSFAPPIVAVPVLSPAGVGLLLLLLTAVAVASLRRRAA